MVDVNDYILNRHTVNPTMSERVGKVETMSKDDIRNALKGDGEIKIEFEDTSEKVVDEVFDILQEREASWGNPVWTHVRIALMMTATQGRPVYAEDAALMFSGMKNIRASINPTDPDSSLDSKGYLKIFDMIIETVGPKKNPFTLLLEKERGEHE